jgi:hypothetical protein
MTINEWYQLDATNVIYWCYMYLYVKKPWKPIDLLITMLHRKYWVKKVYYGVVVLGDDVRNFHWRVFFSHVMELKRTLLKVWGTGRDRHGATSCGWRLYSRWCNVLSQMYVSVQLSFTQKVLVNDFLATGSGSKIEPSSGHHTRTVTIQINVLTGFIETRCFWPPERLLAGE